MPDARRESVAVLSLAAAFTLLGVLAQQVNHWLEYERIAIEGGQAWRLVTAHLTHLGLAHGVLNAAAWILLWRIGRDVVSGIEWAWLLLCSAVAVDAGLYWLSPGIEWYVGASGMLHGAFSGMATLVLARGRRTLGSACLVALAIKLVWEAVTGQGASLAVLDSAPVVTMAHLYGAVGGWMAAVILQSHAASRGLLR